MNNIGQKLEDGFVLPSIKWIFSIFDLDLWLQGYIGDRKPWL